MVDGSNRAALTDFYAAFTGHATDYPAVCREKKHKVLRELLGSDVNRLTNLFTEICETHRDRRDFTRQEVNRAIREIVASFPVYRTYVVPARDEITLDDVRYVDEAVELSKKSRPEMDPELFDFFADVLLLRVRGEKESEFVMRFQQFCGPAMAKGVEDTAFYDFNRLIGLNEVGGDPGVYGISATEFHAANLERQNTHPYAMLASSTHDTKRSEDVRARISVISEIPAEWKAAVQRWSRRNRHAKTDGFPDNNTEYFLYQTMLGAWPIGTDRLLPYMEKACREAKRHTNWLSPNEEFESAVKKFVETIYNDPEFIADLETFLKRLIPAGRINSLSQTLLKFTVPGIPDTYQGTELWDLSLVDPDNRRPVDYAQRRSLLAELPNLEVQEVMRRSDEGLPKLWTIHHALRTRRAHSGAFGDSGTYTPIIASGPRSDHALSFLRGGKVVVLVPLLPLKLADDWAGTAIEMPPGDWENVLSGSEVGGGRVNIADLLRTFPVALLVKR
jgi:(1->4)-alpha-D-glucan 1-alpha-D-glucosylmutase